MVFLFGARWAKNLPAVQETQEMQAQPLGWEDPLEEATATRFSILASKSPQTEEPGWLQFTGLQRVGHNWATEHIGTRGFSPVVCYSGELH